MNDQPNFSTWERETLDKFAQNAYTQIQAQQDALEQLRGDLRDAMNELRKYASASSINNKRLTPR